MNLSGLLPLLRQLPAYSAILDAPPAEPQAVLHAAHPYLLAGLATHRGSPLVVLTARSEMANQLAVNLEAWLAPPEAGGPPVYLFAEPDALPYERISWSAETRQRRLTALAALQSRARTAPPIVIASARALMQKTLPAKELRLALRPLRVGGVVRLDQMTRNWAQTGYHPMEIVEEPGTFARRGGIVDIWPPNLAHPVRIDLFGDEVESLRIFDPATQRTERQVNTVEIGPGNEVLSKYGPAALERLHIRGTGLNAPENLEEGDAESPLHDPRLLLALREELRAEVEQMRDAQNFRGIEWYLPYFYERPASLLDYLPADAALVVDDAAELFSTLQELEDQATGLRHDLERSGELPHNFASSFFGVEELRTELAQHQPLILGFGNLDGKTASANTELARSFAPGPRHGGQTKKMVADIARLRTAGQSTVLLTRQAARMQSLLADADMAVSVESDLVQPPPPGSISLVQGVLGEGFVVRGLDHSGGESANLHFFTDTELFGWSKPRARRRTHTRSSVAPEVFFSDVKTGDFVVHLEHGIGQFDGLVKMELGGVEREYIQVSYAKSDKLYVPVHQADRLSRYVGAGDAKPPVTRLGTADWQTVKERTRREIADIADDLLKLYAERELVEGHSYSPDGPWQEELEASFPFEETPDQLEAIDSVKQDMESERPMDRLICGDVGYGKTEVAVRAAFKAIVDGRQVAVLVPTTVLAQQHYRTFSRRLSRFPVRVEMLSRFRTPAQQQRIIDGLADGSVDLVIGTHRLLSQDVQFKDLGMMIIDEEQRFGVAQKEKLKQLRTQVDVLTLSATPIPRTLHMSLSGVRDMSTINTPPKERQPVHTVLAEYDDLMVRQAIQRELDRNGQVFFVHNRVRGIKTLADRIQRLIPDAKVLTGHGQMPERELEDVMVLFAEGEADVLVCTTIIENGLDIPNANTIIINRADRFGLAQLYQLRGRVGRSAQRGHCYLLYDKHTNLSFDARRRLSAVLESSEELGAGFRIAMRDLEIRGAGDLLGARQHGHIDSVGFDLYTRLLAQAINDAKQKKERFEKAVAKQEGETPANGAAESATEADAESGTESSTESATESHTAVNGAAPAAQPATDGSPFDINDPLAPPVTLDLPLDAQIPQTYIGEDDLRLQMYRRIAGLTSPEAIAEMRKELIDRFGEDEETGGVPVEVDNLLFQIQVKILALRAGVQNIGRELEQLVIRSDALENMNRKAMQRRLRLGLGLLEDDEFVPDEAARVARRAIYLPVDDEGQWRSVLIRTLQIMAYA